MLHLSVSSSVKPCTFVRHLWQIVNVQRLTLVRCIIFFFDLKSENRDLNSITLELNLSLASSRC